MEKASNDNTTNKQKTRGKKRKRKDSDSSESEDVVLPENVLEMEKNVIASAVKNNLDDVSVKKILKKVVTNDHVLALVKLREEEEESSNEESSLRPKLTRAKVKELMKVAPKTAAWNLENLELTPIKHIPVKTRPEVKALIAQELPEDEDDEEYEPTHDEVPSDDDQDLESCSDLDSQPRTPATPRSQKASPQVVRDGPFKVPQDISTPTRRKLNLQEEEATIALRTRSKLCLSETPIEHIESSFVPPDELPLPPVDDHLWNNFLNECLNPASVTRNEDDDETDPEYNVAADPDARMLHALMKVKILCHPFRPLTGGLVLRRTGKKLNDEDEEALESTIIKISKKELNDLVTELFNIIPECSVEEELTSMANSVLTDHSQSENQTSTRWEGKQEPVSDEEVILKPSQKLAFEKGNSTAKLSVGKIEVIDPDYEDVDNDIAKNTHIDKETDEPRKIILQPPNVVRIAVEEKNMGVTPPPATRGTRPSLLNKMQPSNVQPMRIVVNNEDFILPEQVQILQQQLRQHIQLATSNFLQLFVHPLHWTMGPTYKEYLESLNKLYLANPASVVNVCNLRPALDLVRTWEATVSKETPQNKAMVEFIQKESERWRRRSANNSLYVGEFHDTFKRVVANSSVFLYPYLLPPLPYRANATTRRFAYLPSEDELIAIGLDQFWDYVENNPQIYKPPPKVNPRTRFGLTATVELVAKHMFPWLQPKSLMQHVQVVRRNGDKDNAIRKFFANREIIPVKHKLLPYNPALTLYEQPEHEMPRSWIRYLSKTSKRFRGYLHQRSKLQQPPSGVEVQIGVAAKTLTKKPLPIDFTKKITRAHISLMPPKPTANLTDKVDVHIEKPKMMTINFLKPILTNNRPTLVPITVNTTNNMNKEPHMNNLNGSAQTELTSTVDCNRTPISSVVEAKSNLRMGSESIAPVTKDTPKTIDDSHHCTCCVTLRKICKSRQTVITEFFGKNGKSKSEFCHCREKIYPKITNRLKLLINRYKSTTQYICDDIQKKLKDLEEEKVESIERFYETPSAMLNKLDDLSFVTAFQLKLILRLSLAKNIYLKKRVYILLSAFDLDCNDPIKLAYDLDRAFEVDLVDMNKEFVGFLTPEQAEKMDKYRDYFFQNCLEALIEKIEELVPDKHTKYSLLSHLHSFSAGREWGACIMCTELLTYMRCYPELARYTFSLFPHIKQNPKCSESTQDTELLTSSTANNQEEPMEQDMADDTLIVDESQAPVDYEADHSSSGEDNFSEPENDNLKHDPLLIKPDNAVTAEIVETFEVEISKTEVQESCESSDMSLMIMSDEELIKSEPIEWKRDEDKLILEILKQHLTPEERLDKTILEIIEEKQIIQLLEDSLTHKTSRDIRERVLCILKMLAVGES